MSTESGFVQPSIPKFDGHYDHWCMLMENFMRSKEYWSIIENGIPDVAVAAAGVQPTEAQKKASDDAKLKDLEAKNYLFQAIDRSILATILNKDSAKSIWDSLKQKYQGTARVQRSHRQALQKEFELLHMKEGESVNEYFGRTLTIVNRLRVNKAKMDDVVVIEKILRSMTSKFDYVVCSIEESNDLDTLTIDELQSSLLVHEQRMTAHVVEEQALKVTFEEPSRGRGRGRGGFRGGRGRGRGRRNFDKSSIECYKCHQYGHFSYECSNKESQAYYAEDSEEMRRIPTLKRCGILILDAAIICVAREIFSDFQENFREKVKLGDDSSMNVMGKGSIRMLVNGFVQVISGVFCVPGLRNNLISLGQLAEKGLDIIIRRGFCKIYHPEKGQIMEAAMSSNRMFKLFARSQPKEEACFNSFMEDPAQLWHYRYGHLSYSGLKILQHKKMVHGLPRLDFPSKVCEDCLVGKQQRDPFPRKSMWRASQVLELIHSDICGPITPISNSNKRYMITFIDDFSRKTWVYFLAEKSEAFSTFKKYKSLVEKESCLNIKCLRTDRGGEFTSLEFSNFCQENGIRRQLTAAYSPQQNGIAERKNRTIMNMVRSMLSRKRMPKTFWPEAVNWTVHILNKSPTLAVKNKTPEEAWSGVKPSVDYFRVFGCISHVHIPDCKRKKLDDKSIKCVLLGVSEESKAYKLYDPISKKIIISSRDVIFEEDKNWDWEKSHKESVLVDLEWDDSDKESDKDSGTDSGTEENEEETDSVEDSNPSESENSPGTNADPSLDINEQSPRMQRMTRQPRWMQDYESGEGLSEEDDITNFVMFAENDPVLFEDAVKDAKWRVAMDKEIEAIEKNGTWELVDLPTNAKKIRVKWVFKTKLNEHGEVEKYKARLVAKGYTQKYGVANTEVFAPVARLETIRLVISLAAHNKWHIFQLDVKSAFLHGDLNEEVFVEQPPGYEKKGAEQKVYRLKKALYGLKQAPRAWYSQIDAYFVKEGFQRCPYEHTLFIKSDGGKILIVCLYVDDLIFTGNDEHMFVAFKKSMMKEFDMTDLGKMRYFLGIEVLQGQEQFFICQKRYTLEVLEKFDMNNCNSVHNLIVPGSKLTKDEDGVRVDSSRYKQLIGSLMYLTATRPDIMFVVSLLSRYMEHPTELHLKAAKRVLRYLKGTSDFGILYTKKGDVELIGYTDSDYAGDVDDRRSTSGYVFQLNSGAVSWSSKKQPIVTLSTTEAEYVAAASCACQTVWLKRILEGLKQVQTSITTIFCDNSSTIELSKNPVLHGRSKHIDVRFHFLRDLTKVGVVKLVYCPTQNQLADIMTKPLKLDVFERLRNLLGVCSGSNIN